MLLLHLCEASKGTLELAALLLYGYDILCKASALSRDLSTINTFHWKQKAAHNI